MKEVIDVVGAIIEKEDKILCMLRPNYKNFGNMWEFPGGKIEKYETKEEALKREIKEELNLDIKIKNFYEVISKEYENIIINLSCFKCEILDEKDLVLLEHSGYVWLSRKNLKSLIWVPTDIFIVEKLISEE